MDINQITKVSTKKCSRCKVIKSTSEFNKNKRRKDGLKYYCKECRKSESDKIKDKERKRKWYCLRG